MIADTSDPLLLLRPTLRRGDDGKEMLCETKDQGQRKDHNTTRLTRHLGLHETAL